MALGESLVLDSDPERIFTEADLAALPAELPSGPVWWELDHGRLLAMPLPELDHSIALTNLACALKRDGELRGHGRAVGRVGVVLWRSPDRVVGADAAFIASGSLPARRSPEDYLETIPELVVEVVSIQDTPGYVRRKVEDYLTAGVKVVWLANPATHTVTEYRPAGGPREYRDGDTLTVEDLIPGFSMPIEEVFRV
ncbi:MAG: Uma2 family endonuclease [Armatimonadota bacterium]